MTSLIVRTSDDDDDDADENQRLFPLPSLSVNAIVSGLEADQSSLITKIKERAESIDRLQRENSQDRARLRQVKRMLTASKPPRPKKTAAKKATKA
jgi:hypothetical protein